MKKGFTVRLDSEMIDCIKEVATESGISQREVVELSVLACMRLGLFEALDGSGLDTEVYGSLVRVACDGHLADELYQHVKNNALLLA